jgi:hypothetical protein
MPAALGADPELVGRPRHAGAGLAHVHLRAAALAADLKVNLAHPAILAQERAHATSERENVYDRAS